MTVAQSHIQIHTDFFVTIPYNYERHMKHFQDFITIYKHITIKQITKNVENEYSKHWRTNHLFRTHLF